MNRLEIDGGHAMILVIPGCLLGSRLSIHALCNNVNVI